LSLRRGFRLSVFTLVGFCAPRLGGQAPRRQIVVRVTESAGVPVLAAQILAYDARSAAVTTSRTDSAGYGRLEVPIGADSITLTARKVGYDAVSRTVSVRPADLLLIELSLSRAPTELPKVAIEAARLRRERQPFIDAAEIAADKRSILSLSDVIKKLRWGITYQAHKCLPPRPSGAFTPGPIPATSFDVINEEVYVNGRWIPWEWDPGHLIHSEHIAEIRYVNCFDKSIEGLPQQPWPALYISLKPGISWDLKRGSYEDLDRAALDSTRMAPELQRQTRLDTHSRILGVYADDSGNPIAGVAVVDSASGTQALTTSTGTVDLGFLADGSWTMFIRKSGYVEQKILVEISATKLTPITVVLSKSRAAPPM
jgi:hypothetical protein